MARHKEQLDAEAVARKVVFGYASHVDPGSLSGGGVDLDGTVVEEVRDRDDLRVVTLHVDLLDLSSAEGGYRLAEKIFVHYGVLLQVGRGAESHEHNDVVGLFVITEEFHQMPVHILGIGLELLLCRKVILQLCEFLEVVEEHVVEVIDDDFVVTSVLHHIFLAAFDLGD